MKTDKKEQKTNEETKIDKIKGETANFKKTMRINTYFPDISSENRIKNTKYTFFSFVPRIFYEQIKFPSSCFFFIIMLIQYDERLAVGSFMGNLFPFCLILVMTMINEGVDDYKRYKRDIAVNAAVYKKYIIDKQTKRPLNASIFQEDGFFTSVTAANIKTGDIIKVPKGEKFPADCLLLKSAEENGEIFIRTDQLDGETDWKRRQCPMEITEIDSAITAEIEKPHKNIYQFTGRMTIKSEIPINISLDLENTAWAETVAATSDVLGLVIHTGTNTRARMNTCEPRTKFGTIDREIDYFVTILIACCALCAISFTALRVSSLSVQTTIVFLRFLILFSFLIPVSLKVTINSGRIVYMNYASKNITIRNSTIQEELGRISFFLTDKTGTLTKNEMLMKKVHLGQICYDESSFKDMKSILKRWFKNYENKSKKPSHRMVYEIMETLALCHNVTPVETSEGVVYQASSPDEIAIVEFCEVLGVKLFYRDKNVIKIRYILGDERNREFAYKIHHIFPFNSDTKRMGIILEREDSSYVFFEKGADAVMKRIIKESDWAEEETDDMARDGLRTLMIAKKELSKEQFMQFDAEYTEAKLTMLNRNEKMLNSQKKLERGLELLGLTGVEDKLQDNVMETLESLRNADIKIWMLTGDKIETAISIAKSSRLLNKTDTYLIISDCKTITEIREKLNLLKTKRYDCLCIDGKSLTLVLDNPEAENSKRNYLLESFVEETRTLAAVIGCRYTPTQKAMMANALKRIAGETVLCIGDGGNDVSMITEADVGVGIEGKEGNQASLSADFSLNKFCYVTELLFCHGRTCYTNTATIGKISIQRSAITAILQAVFSAMINCMPLGIMQGNMGMLFTVVTYLPVCSLMIVSDTTPSDALKYPELYKELKINNLCSLKEFVSAILVSYLQSVIIALGCYFILVQEKELHLYSIITFIAIVLNEYCSVLLAPDKPKLTSLVAIVISLIAFGISTFFFEEINIDFFILKRYLLYLLLVNLAAASIKFFLKIYHSYLSPAAHIKIANNKKLETYKN
ncbi:P-type ATPase [Nucleospora cyclopteri]